MSETTQPRPPLLLVAADQEWPSRALETTLGPQGYAFLRAYNEKQALDLATRLRPDVVMIGDQVAGVPGLDICRTLREKSAVTDSTAILMLVTGPETPEVRLDALRAGASDCVGIPFDFEELTFRLIPYVRAKLDADRARAGALVDPSTGLYNLKGLTRRARELAARAYRDGAALSCVIVAPEIEGSAVNAEELITRFAPVFTGTGSPAGGRGSDAVGRVSESAIGIFAPETTAQGAERLIRRVRGALANAAKGLGVPATLRFKAGSYTVLNFRETPMDPGEMLTKASASLGEGR